MKLAPKVCRLSTVCIRIGFGLMSFALFLHPMNPDDFLALALFAPLETIRDAYGIQAAVLFWISVALVFLGMIGLARRIELLKSRWRPLLE